MRLLDDYLFTSICFWEHWFLLENKLRFLNFPVGAGGVVVQKKPPKFSLLIFHRAPPSRGSTALLGLPWKITLYLLIFLLLIFSELILREKNQSGEGRNHDNTVQFDRKNTRLGELIFSTSNLMDTFAIGDFATLNPSKVAKSPITKGYWNLSVQ